MALWQDLEEEVGFQHVGIRRGGEGRERHPKKSLIGEGERGIKCGRLNHSVWHTG